MSADNYVTATGDLLHHVFDYLIDIDHLSNVDDQRNNDVFKYHTEAQIETVSERWSIILNRISNAVLPKSRLFLQNHHECIIKCHSTEELCHLNG